MYSAGIDVGGTFTDAVLLHGGTIAGEIKVPTQTHLHESILSALSEILRLCPDPARVHRLVLSSTLITNIFAANQQTPVGLILIPGPGLPLELFQFPCEYRIIEGGMNFHGDTLTAVQTGDIRKTALSFLHRGIRHIGVVAKFSGRNPELEHTAARAVTEASEQITVLTGSAVWSGLNFPRRAAATALTLACRDTVSAFFRNLQSRVKDLGIRCQLEILKADGGIMPLAWAENHPLETVFTGPAASAMGSVALSPAGSDTIFLDIGGSTTDIGLILAGRPLLARRGLLFRDCHLPIRGFSLASVPHGGDSPVIHDESGISISRIRKGPPVVDGGTEPTVTDAARVLGFHSLGSLQAAESAFDPLSSRTGLPVKVIARRVMDRYRDLLNSAIARLHAQWIREPVFRLWELERHRGALPGTVTAVGAGSELLAPVLKELNRGGVFVPRYARVANALGAALARPTCSVTLHADTGTGWMTVSETGQRQAIPDPADFRICHAEAAARTVFKDTARTLNAPVDGMDMDLEYSEQFNILSLSRPTRRIMDVKLSMNAGLVEEWIHGHA